MLLKERKIGQQISLGTTKSNGVYNNTTDQLHLLWKNEWSTGHGLRVWSQVSVHDSGNITNLLVLRALHFEIGRGSFKGKSPRNMVEIILFLFGTARNIVSMLCLTTLYCGFFNTYYYYTLNLLSLS